MATCSVRLCGEGNTVPGFADALPVECLLDPSLRVMHSCRVEIACVLASDHSAFAFFHYLLLRRVTRVVTPSSWHTSQGSRASVSR
jgi:hypothetical protein